MVTGLRQRKANCTYEVLTVKSAYLFHSQTHTIKPRNTSNQIKQAFVTDYICLDAQFN